MDQISISSGRDGFDVTVSGRSADALGARRIVGQFSNDPPGDPADESVTFHIPRGNLKSLLLAIAPHAQRNGIPLARDEAVSAALASVRKELAALRAAFEGNLKSSKVDLGNAFKRSLTTQQVSAVGRLLALPHGANFSVPGAGKTTITLAVHQILKSRGDVDRLLVVAPRNAFRPWEEEVEACYSEPPRVVRLAGGVQRVRQLLARAGPGSVLLIGYQQAYFAADALERWFAENDHIHLVLDESHRIKNPRRGPWAATVLRLAALSARRDILTGTPAPNSMADLSTQLSFLWPFQSVIPEADLRDPASEDRVASRLRPLYVRITKKQLGLTRPAPVQVPVGMGAIQARIHELVRQRIAKLVGPLRPELEAISSLRTHVIRLLQIASNPTLLLSASTEFRIPPLDAEGEPELSDLLEQYPEYEVPPKFAFAAKRVEERSRKKKKTIVWSSFVRNLDMMAAMLNAFEPVVLHGGVPTALDMDEPDDSTREALVDKFKNDDACFVLIANPSACSESISLHHHCDHAIYLDRTFNAATFLQSMDRIHRLGLPPNAKVSYELLVAPGTIDETIDRRLSEKVRLLGRLLDDDALQTVDLDEVDESTPLAFDEKDARAVIEFLSGARSRTD